MEYEGPPFKGITSSKTQYCVCKPETNVALHILVVHICICAGKEFVLFCIDEDEEQENKRKRIESVVKLA